MAYCPKCGSMLEDDAAFCGICGASVTRVQEQAAAYKAAAQQADTPIRQQGTEATEAVDQKDIDDNKIYAALAYFGPTVLLPILASPKSKFARFHANQGLLLCCIYGIEIILSILLSLIKVDRLSLFGFYTRVTPWYIGLLIFILWLPAIGWAVLGAINGGTGKYKKLPFIGELFTFLK